MAVLGINSRAACFSHFHSRHSEINFFERIHRARIDAENAHRRVLVLRPRLRIIEAETQGYPTTGYLRVPSDTVEYDRESRKVSGSRADPGTVYGYLGRSLANSGQTPTRDKTSIADYSAGWHLETNSFHHHVRLV